MRINGISCPPESAIAPPRALVVPDIVAFEVDPFCAEERFAGAASAPPIAHVDLDLDVGLWRGRARSAVGDGEDRHGDPKKRSDFAVSPHASFRVEAKVP